MDPQYVTNQIKVDTRVGSPRPLSLLLPRSLERRAARGELTDPHRTRDKGFKLSKELQ